MLEADGIEFTGGNAPRGVEAGATSTSCRHRDRSNTLTVLDGGVGRAGQVEEKSLVRLEVEITTRLDGDYFAGVPR